MVLCKVFRSGRKAETYLYLAQHLDFEDLPPELREVFGEPAFVMQLQLSAERRLARVDVTQVLEQLERSGFFLQMPSELPVEEEISNRLT